MSKEISLETIVDKIYELEEKIESAFTRDEYGKLDLTGHRHYHKKQTEVEAEFSKTKNKIIRDVITWAVLGMLSVIVGLLAKAYLLPTIIPHIGP